MLGASLGAFSQDSTHVSLEEVEVKAAKIVAKADGQLIVPSDTEKQSSTNGYSLLAKLGLPTIRIDESAHTIVALGQQGSVQVRINEAICSRENMLALDPKTVKSIDFIDKPGVRYGQDVAYVINIKTHGMQSGYTLGSEHSNALSTLFGANAVYAKWGYGASQWQLAYDFGYQYSKGNRYEEEADYLLNDGSHRIIARETKRYRTRNHNHGLNLQYNLTDSNTVFQASVSTQWDHSPLNKHQQEMTDGAAISLFSTDRTERSFTPTADLYLFSRIGNHQTITANAVATSILTNAFAYNDEQTVYQYDINGSTWAVILEGIYENRLKPFTLSIGMRSKMKHIKNEYQGDVNALIRTCSNGQYLFGEAKGKWARLGYVAGMGVSHEYYRQSAYHHDFWLLRPKLTLTFSPATPWMISYGYEMKQHISQVAMVSDTRIRRNSMEWIVGNPELKPNRVIAHTLSISFSRPSIYSQIVAEYRLNPNCNLAHYERTPDNQFLYSQKIQRGVNMFYVANNTRWDVVNDKLTVSAYSGIYRFINRGDHYTHFLTSYNAGASIQAYLGRWTLKANVDNGWKFMEGETWNHQGASTSVGCTYRIGHCTFSLSWQQPLQSNPYQFESGLLNAQLKKALSLRSADYGNRVTIGFSWRLQHGKSYQTENKRLHNQDKQTGILL